MRVRAVLGGMLLGTVLIATASANVQPATGSAAPTRGGWIVDRVRVESLAPGGHLGVAGVGDYRGALEVLRSGSGLGVINDVGFEDYVRGIAEVPNGWPMEALKAQAIAARTYALHEMKSRQSPAATALGADICPTQSCQVYVGLEKERSEGGGRWVSAVEATRGQVLLRRGRPIRAMYSAGPYSPPPPAPGQPPPPPGPVRGHGAGMDQHGALAKALRGAKASAILASYYGGAKPTRLTPPRIPQTIRVSLEPVRSTTGISGPGRFRVLDGAGNPLAVVATGNWRVHPGPQGKVRVVPPPGQDAPPAVEALGHEPSPPPASGQTLRFRLSTPALVHLVVSGPDGAPATVTTPQLVEAGESALPVPPLTLPGPHVVSVVADAGANRVMKAPVDISTGGAAVPAPAEPVTRPAEAVVSDGRRVSRESSPPVLLAATAFILLLTAIVGLVLAWLRPSAT